MMLNRQQEEAVIDRLATLVDARDEFFDRFDLPRDHPLWGMSDWQLGAVVDFLLTPENVETPLARASRLVSEQQDATPGNVEEP